MTKVERRYGLSRPLDADLRARLARLHSVYGFLRLELRPEGLVVNYDASRLSEADVEANLRQSGIPIEISD